MREKVQLSDNKFMPDEKFVNGSTYNSTYINNQIHKAVTQIHPEDQIQIGNNQFEGNSSYVSDYLHRKPKCKN